QWDWSFHCLQELQYYNGLEADLKKIPREHHEPNKEEQCISKKIHLSSLLVLLHLLYLKG
nr:hypothetical protein [Tanacetum cinerariifolium]